MDFNLTNASASFIGEDASDQAGCSVAGAGDVNGDGFDDFLIGAYGDDAGGSSAGQTYLILGKSTGWTMDFELTNASASFIGEDSSDNSGYSVSGAGDVNGDGYDDILIGAYKDEDGGSEAGQTYLVLGKASGWSMYQDLSAANASFIGEDSNDWSGYSVSGAGDVNADGFDDILIGAYQDEEAGSDAGQTYLIYGMASGWSMDVSLTNASASFLGEDAGDRSGYSVAGAGDVNGDGYDDMLVGADRDEDGGSQAGQTYLILSNSRPPEPRDLTVAASRDGESILLSWSPPIHWNEPITGYRIYRSTDGANYDNIAFTSTSKLWYADPDVFTGYTYHYAVVTVDGDGEYSGRTSTASLMCEPDIDGDGIGDSHDTDADGDGIPNTYDGDPAIRDNIAWGRMDADLGDFGAGFIGEDAGDWAGHSLAGAGDVNGDGFDDILIGAYKDEERGAESGQTYLFLGSSSGWSGDADLSDADASFRGESAEDYSGYSVAVAGDVNGDGYDDILIGAYKDDDGGVNAGQTYLILGRASGWTMDEELSDADASFVGESGGDYSGECVAGAGDVNGDGFDDILIGAYGDSEGGGTAGQTYLIFGKATGWVMDVSLSGADASFLGEEGLDYSGGSVDGVGDVNGDGFDDIIIGASGNDEGGNSAGQAYLIMGKASGWAMDVDLENASASFYGEAASDKAGYAVSGAGDVNGDGLWDILIGAHQNTEGGSLAGQTYLILGKTSGWTMDVNLSNSDASFMGEDENDMAGYAISGAGDVNGDGYDDILIGAYGDDDGGSSAGQTYLIYGRSTGWMMDVGLSNASASFVGEDGDDFSGRSLSGAGDVDGDGFDDILIGAYGDDNGGNEAGRIYLLARSQLAGKEEFSLNLTSLAPGINLQWDDTYGNPYFTGIYRGLAPNLLSRLAYATGTGYTDEDVTAGVAYYYAVANVDPLGSESLLSPVLAIVADSDLDGDGIGNLVDGDDDGDGVPDGEDYFPTNASEWLDSDLDGIGNNADDDDDNDGIVDISDPYPYSNINDMNSEFDNITDMLISINNTVNDVQDRVMDIQSDLSFMNTSIGDVQAGIDYLNSTIPASLNDLENQLSGVNDSLKSRIDNIDNNLTGVETNLMAELALLNSSLVQEIAYRVSNITSDMSGLNLSLAGRLTDLSNNLTTEHNDLRAWIDIALGEIDSNLTSVNLSLSGRITGLETMTNGFYTSLRNNLTDVKGKLVSMENNLTVRNGMLNDTIALLSSAMAGQLNVTKEVILEKLNESYGLLSDLNHNTTEHDSDIGTLLAELKGLAGTGDNLTHGQLMDNISILRNDLLAVSNDIAVHDTAVKAKISNLTTMLDSLSALDLSELNDGISGIVSDLVEHDIAVRQGLSGINSDIDNFHNGTIVRLDNIIESLERLTKLDDILDQLELLDQSLKEAENELSVDIEKYSGGDEGEIDVKVYLLIGILVLLIVILLILLFRKQSTGSQSPSRGEAYEPEGHEREEGREASLSTKTTNLSKRAGRTDRSSVDKPSDPPVDEEDEEKAVEDFNDDDDDDIDDDDDDIDDIDELEIKDDEVEDMDLGVDDVENDDEEDNDFEDNERGESTSEDGIEEPHEEDEPSESDESGEKDERDLLKEMEELGEYPELVQLDVIDD